MSQAKEQYKNDVSLLRKHLRNKITIGIILPVINQKGKYKNKPHL